MTSPRPSSIPDASEIAGRLTALLGNVNNAKVLIELGVIIMQLQSLGTLQQKTTPVLSTSLGALKQALDEANEVSIRSDDDIFNSFIKLRGAVANLYFTINIVRNL